MVVEHGLNKRKQDYISKFLPVRELVPSNLVKHRCYHKKKRFQSSNQNWLITTVKELQYACLWESNGRLKAHEPVSRKKKVTNNFPVSFQMMTLFTKNYIFAWEWIRSTKHCSTVQKHISTVSKIITLLKRERVRCASQNDVPKKSLASFTTQMILNLTSWRL